MGRKNVLVSAYFAKNVGDDLFLKLLFERYENVNWYLLTADQQYKMIFKNYPHVNIIPLYREIGHINMFIMFSKLFNHFKKYDAFVMIGGSIFMQNEDWQKTYSLRIEIMKLLKKYHIPSYIIGANFGPYQDKAFKEKYFNHFKSYTGICFRDLYSYQLFDQLDNVVVAPDAVFTLNRTEIKPNKKYIGISPIYLHNRVELRPYEKQYYFKHKEIIQYYVERNYTVRLFSFCQYEGDLRGITEIMNLVTEEMKQDIEVINYTGNLNNFLQQFQACSVIIGTRFHSLILAMKFKQRFLPIIYSDKIVNSLKGIGIENLGYFIHDIYKLKVKNIEVEYNDVIGHTIYEKAEKQFYYLDQLLTHKN